MKIDELRLQILEFARRSENIRLAVETGAFARDSPPADELSDLDIEFYVENPAVLLESRAWIEAFGCVLICLELENEGFNPTRLVIFASGEKVDFSLYDAKLLATGFRSQAQNRGCIVHLDKDGATRDWSELAPPQIEKPDAATWRALIDDFYLDSYNAAKYLARGDLWTAKWVDAEVKKHLLKLLEWHGATRGAEVWHLGHHLQNWTDAATYAEIETIFAAFEAAESWRAMKRSCDLFGRLAREVAANWNLDYPLEVEAGIRALMNQMKDFDAPNAQVRQ